MITGDDRPVKSADARAVKAEAADCRVDGVTAGTLVVVLSTLALVAYLVVTMRSAPPMDIVEIIAAASGLLAAVGRVLRRK
jgi:hypothetical protein